MTTLRLNEDVSVEDRAAECLIAITAIYDDGMAHVAFLSQAWSTPPVPSAPTLLAAALAEPVGTAVPAPEPVLAVAAAEPVEVPVDEPAVAEPAVVLPDDERAMLPTDVVAEAPTATELPVATFEEPGTELLQVGDREVLDEGRVLVLADAVTAEIPVQKAA
ncbi:hypothetical protein [Modestobacter sp. URMC 112]